MTHISSSKHGLSKNTETPAPNSTFPKQQQIPDINHIVSNPTEKNLTPDTIMYLQRTIGNAAVNQVISRMSESDQAVQRTSHERGCNCSGCRRVQLMRNDIQRWPFTKKAEKTPQEKFKKGHVRNKKKMQALADVTTSDEFRVLAVTKGVKADKIAIALIQYYDPLTLGDLEPLIGSMNARGKKKLWSDAALMTKAETKIGKDPYLTFATKLGMHHPTTTKELYEGGKEHTPAAKADEIIRDKLDSYVAEAVTAGKKIEGYVAVVASADWDRAGIAHYGKDVWDTGPPPKTPKKDAINGFVDSTGRVWVERNSGNPGTIIHEGIHKYSNGATLSQLGFYINEGITEYFTRVICKDLDVDRGNYDSQYAVVKKLVANVASEDILAKAYFDGDIDGLKAAFITYREDNKSESEEDATTKWDEFVDKFSAGDYADALNLIR